MCRMYIVHIHCIQTRWWYQIFFSSKHLSTLLRFPTSADFRSESGSFFQKVRNIPKRYPELEFWISCLLLWVENSNFKFRIVIWNICFGDLTHYTFWEKDTFSWFLSFWTQWNEVSCSWKFISWHSFTNLQKMYIFKVEKF